MKRLAWLLLLGCTDSDPTVVVYDGLDDEPGRMVVAQAQRELPFTVKRLGDTEATKTASQHRSGLIVFYFTFSTTSSTIYFFLLFYIYNYFLHFFNLQPHIINPFPSQS